MLKDVETFFDDATVVNRIQQRVEELGYTAVLKPAGAAPLVQDLSGSHSFWLLTIPAVVWPSLLAMVVSLKVQAKVASVEEGKMGSGSAYTKFMGVFPSFKHQETSETTEDVQASGLPEKPGAGCGCSDKPNLPHR